MNRSRPPLPSSRLAAALALLAVLSPGIVPARAEQPQAGAYLVFDARSGEVLAKRNADQAWYPASVTKLMTAWVTLQAIRAGRLRPTSPVPMTAVAARQPPSKMGFRVGEVVTVDNALKIIMVKSANDVAWALAEAVGGSKEAFVGEMNRQARLLGMTSTRWGNPNGLPDPTQVSTARDLGLLARALLTEFPEASGLWHLPGIQLGDTVIPNHNHLLDRYPGADGMKTGFICASGFNVVATATRGDRKLVAVVLGSRSARARAELAAELFTKGFQGSGGDLFGRFSTPETIAHMARGPEAGSPVKDIRQEVCGRKRDRMPDPEDLGEIAQADPSREASSAVIKPGEPGWAPIRPTSYLSAQRFDIGPPVRVWLGGADAAPADAGTLLSLAPTNDPTRLMAAPTFAAAAALPAAPGAIRPRPVMPDIPAGGYGSTLPAADGAPMTILSPALATTSPPPVQEGAAKAPVRSAATRPSATKAAAKAVATRPARKTADVPIPAGKPRKKTGG